MNCHVRILLGMVAVFASACSGVRLTFPPAATPVLTGSGVEIVGAGGVTTVTGTLQPYCDRYVAESVHPDGMRGIYVNLRYPGFTNLRASYAGQAMEMVDGPAPGAESVAIGPRPYAPDLIARAQGSESFFWIHEEVYDEAAAEVDVVVAVILGAQAPEVSDLRFWTESSNPDLTGTDASSLPLVLNLTYPIEVKTFEIQVTGGGNEVREGQPYGLVWEVLYADDVRISGPGFSGAESVEPFRVRNLQAGCNASARTERRTYNLTARLQGCTSPVEAAAASVDVAPETYIDYFRGVITQQSLAAGVPVVTEGIPFALEWSAPGATSVDVSGPDVSSGMGLPATDDILVTPGPMPTSSLPVERRSYSMTAHLPTSACRTTESRNTTVDVNAVTALFHYREVCPGDSTVMCSQRSVRARSQSEANQIAEQRRPRNCQWVSGTC